MSSVKTAVLDVANQLSEDATWEQAKHELWLREKIDRDAANVCRDAVVDRGKLFNELLKKEDWSESDHRLYDECVRSKLEHAHAQAEAGMLYDEEEVFAELLSDEDDE
ncbi:MAG TPA: hypothetical protein VK137_21190 [Planctomycetaceae bacterium]|nr:hypothetical protein [Planctomycetaceae bacterium]